MRLFIALNLPGTERARIHEAAEPLRNQGLPVRWVDEDKLHVTLKFLGDVRKTTLPDVQRIMAEVAGSTSTFDMKLRGFGAFPTIRKPRVVWLGVEASPELRCLKQDLEWGLSDCGFDPETRAFHPHVTLGRADEKGAAGAFRGLDEMVAGMEFDGSVPVESVDLMKSRLAKGGALYETVFTAELATD